MRKPVVLITGANGEMGHGLIDHLSRSDHAEILALDLNPLDPEIRRRCSRSIVGDVLDERLLQRLVSEYEIHTIFHLAAILSTRAEYTPDTAHRVNVDGTLNLLQLAAEQARWHGHTVKFLFPSSIAVYGLPDTKTKNASAPVQETEWNFPTTMYGCNKLYCEHLGRYFTLNYRQLSAEPVSSGVDFRAIRFPGLISAVTLPQGGTSDYAPEMLHAAAQGQPYGCFVAADARIPFMAMPDAILALLRLAEAPAEGLKQRVYNVTSFEPSAGEIAERITAAFPGAEVRFEPDAARVAIVDTWPARVDDTPARQQWGWQPDYDIDRAFDEYLIPTITRYYKS